MSRYIGEFVQTGNSCGAATLMIALYEKDSKNNPVNADREKLLYAKTIEKDDPRLKQYGYSSPKNIITTAKEFGLDATLYKTKDINLSYLDKGQQEQLRDFVDNQAPKEVATDQLIALLNQGSLQTLAFIGKEQDSKHWLLLRKESPRSKYFYLYDTALGSDMEIQLPQSYLSFFSKLSSSDKSRKYTFLGVAIHLST